MLGACGFNVCAGWNGWGCRVCGAASSLVEAPLPVVELEVVLQLFRLGRAANDCSAVVGSALQEALLFRSACSDCHVRWLVGSARERPRWLPWSGLAGGSSSLRLTILNFSKTAEQS